MEQLLAAGKVDVIKKYMGGRTALSYATENGHETVVELLLAMSKVDVDMKRWSRQTALSPTQPTMGKRKWTRS